MSLKSSGANGRVRRWSVCKIGMGKTWAPDLSAKKHEVSGGQWITFVSFCSYLYSSWINSCYVFGRALALAYANSAITGVGIKAEVSNAAEMGTALSMTPKPGPPAICPRIHLTAYGDEGGAYFGVKMLIEPRVV